MRVLLYKFCLMVLNLYSGFLKGLQRAVWWIRRKCTQWELWCNKKFGG
jgi:hypothetical protein